MLLDFAAIFDVDFSDACAPRQTLTSRTVAGANTREMALIDAGIRGVFV